MIRSENTPLKKALRRRQRTFIRIRTVDAHLSIVVNNPAAAAGWDVILWDDPAWRGRIRSMAGCTSASVEQV